MPPTTLLVNLVLSAILCGSVLAHPLPDVPVQATFDESGVGVVRVEVDLRLFDSEPATAPYFNNEYLPGKPPAWRTDNIEKARAFVAANIEFFLDPGGRATPEWEWAFTSQKNAPLAKDDDPVVLTGTWRTAAGAKGYRIRSTPENKWSVLFLNTLRGKEVERTQVLFPGESSFVLDLTAPAPPAPAAKNSAAPWWKRIFGGA
ncbi:MAG: hypothetical protein WCF18_09310 [Chthoniobacteraceae bacterium]